MKRNRIRKRRGIPRTAFSLAWSVGICLLVGSAANADSIIDLGTLGGDYSDAYAINTTGQVVGGSYTANGQYDAFLYSGGTMSDLGTLGGPSSLANGINSTGQIVGTSQNASGLRSAFSYSGNTMTSLGTLGGNNSYGYGINDSGQMVGTSDTSGGERAFLYSGGVMSSLGTLGGYSSGADAINASGEVVGYAQTANGDDNAFLFSEGLMSDLGTFGGDYSFAYGINDAGQVVGDSYTAGGADHAFLYSGGSMSDLGTLGGAYSVAYGINTAGEIVGTSTTALGATDAFLFYGGVMTDLNSLLPANSGWTLEAANAINDSGQIVGYGINPEGQTDAFLLSTQGSAAPEPASVFMLGSGVAILLFLRKIRSVRRPAKRTMLLTVTAVFLTTSPIFADIVYDNGPANGGLQAWGISSGNVVSDSFTLSSDSTIDGVNLVSWTDPGNPLTDIDWSITSAPDGGTSYDSATETPVSSTFLCSSTCNIHGYNIDENSFSIPDLSLAAGTYYLNLSVEQDITAYWDVNNGPSVAFSNPGGSRANWDNAGGSGSNTFQILDAAPEPGNFVMLCSGLFAIVIGFRNCRKG